MSKVDFNNEYYTLAFDGTNPQPLKVDPITGRLLVEITAIIDPPSVLNSAKIDVNNESVSLVVDDNGTIRPLQVNSSNNLLFVDLLVE